jgi:hypothetical protein
MKREVQDNSIQDKINGLKEIPESIFFSAEQNWLQLERQLQPRKNNRKALVLWSAAIFLLLICTLAIRYNITLKKQNPQTTANNKIKTEKNNIPDNTAVIQKITLAPAAIKSMKKTTLIVPAYTPSISLISEKKDSSSTATTETNHINTLAIPEFKDSTKQVITINTPIRNKLKIVHINELNAPRPQVIAVNKNLSLGEIMMEALKLNPEPEMQMKNILTKYRKYTSHNSTTDNP